MTLAAGGKVDVADVTGLGIAKLQDGTVDVPITAASFATATVTFPTAFSATPVLVTSIRSGAGAAIGATTLVTALSATGFTVRVTLTASGTVTPTVHWVAVL